LALDAKDLQDKRHSNSTIERRQPKRESEVKKLFTEHLFGLSSWVAVLFDKITTQHFHLLEAPRITQELNREGIVLQSNLLAGRPIMSFYVI
jgi:hypothetical protein